MPECTIAVRQDGDTQTTENDTGGADLLLRPAPLPVELTLPKAEPAEAFPGEGAGDAGEVTVHAADLSKDVDRNRLLRELRSGRYDVVHVHEPLTPSASMFATLAAKAPVVD